MQPGLTVLPAPPCGARLPLTLSIAYTGVGTHPAEIPLAIQVGRAGAPTLTSYAGPPVAIPDGDLTGVDIPLAIAATGPLASVRFHIDGSACTTDPGATTVGIDHTWVSDLALHLTSPSGTTVTLLDAIGGPFNNGHNLCQTVLDDAAPSSIQSVSPFEAPYSGVYQPASPLAAFTGEEASGTWTLHVSDSTFFDSGSVRAFSIETSGFSCDP